MGSVDSEDMLEDLEFTKRDEKILYIAEAIEKYKKAGISGKTNFGERPAVLIVDVQKGFTSPECPLGGNMDSMVENLNKLIPEARNHKVPIIFTRVAYREDTRDCGVFGEKVPTLPRWFRDGGGWDGIDTRIAPRPEDFVITKKMPSAFFGTDLFHQLTYLKADTLVVCGCTTSGCVRATVVDSMSHGFRTIIPEECVEDRSPGPHKAALFDMSTKYADVVRLEKVLDYIRSLPTKELAPTAQVR
jgi:nicotinamidase-related amidase